MSSTQGHVGTKASLQWSLDTMEGEEREKASTDNSLLSLLTYVKLGVALLIETKNYNSNFYKSTAQRDCKYLCPGSHDYYYVRSSPSIFSVATGIHFISEVQRG